MDGGNESREDWRHGTGLKVVAGIPAYNEEMTIGNAVLLSEKYVSSVLVYDDGSEDLTGVIAKRLGAKVIGGKTNLGKGEALRHIISEARRMDADILVTLDGDGQHNPDEIPLLMEPIAKGIADLVIGSRFMKGSKSVPTYRRFGNLLLNTITYGLKGLTDSQSGFRAYGKRAIDLLHPGEQGMGVDSELLMDSMAKGLRIVEVPISVRYGHGKTSKLNPGYHILDVAASIVKLTSIRHPLLFYGIPGLAILLLGIVLGALAIAQFYSGQPFWLQFSLASVLSIVVGLLMLFTAVILFSLITVIRKMLSRG